MLSFYDVDKNYRTYLQQIEIDARGFTRIPNMDYEGEPKFLCGVVLEMGEFNYYVPMTSYKKKQSENEMQNHLTELM